MPAHPEIERHATILADGQWTGAGLRDSGALPTQNDAALEAPAEVLELAHALMPVVLPRHETGDHKKAVRLRIAPLREWTSETVHARSGGDALVSRLDERSPAVPTGAHAIVPIVKERVWSVGQDPSTGSSESPVHGGFALVVELESCHEWTREEIGGLRTVGDVVARELRLRGEFAVVRSIALWEQVNRFQDPVTELPNRELFVERVEQVVHRAARHHGFHFAVLCLDIDRVESIYHGLGRCAGDSLVRGLAERLKPLVRSEDLLARSPSEGFLILLDEVSGAVGASRVAVRIQNALATPLIVDDVEIHVSVTIGIALGSGRVHSADHLVGAAAVARARAEELGTGEFQIFEPEMQTRVRRRLDLETELRRAVDRQEFEVFYQPLVCLATGQIVELEALVRWNHPTRGRVNAGEFIGVAEESELILPIGRWVIANACRQVHAWHQRFRRNAPLGLTVNVAAKLLALDGFADTISGMLADSCLDPSALRLEITESVLIANPGAARTRLGELRAAGVSIYLDDFGAGYSSLRYLRDLPLDGIKLDRAFIEHITDVTPDAQSNMPIVRTVRQLARDMGVKAIAEGVETAAQLSALRDLGYDLAQGYHVARPMPASQVEELLSAR